MNTNIEALKALALAMPGAPWKVQHPYARARGYEVADSSGLNQICENVTKQIADYIAAANPTTVLELIAENQRLKLERDTLDRDCALGAKRTNEAADEIQRLRAELAARSDSDAEPVVWQWRHRLKGDKGWGAWAVISKGRYDRRGDYPGMQFRELFAGPREKTRPECSSESAETRMDSGFERGPNSAAPAVGTEKDAERYRHIRDTENNGYDLRGESGIGKWHVSRKRREGEGEYFFGERLDAMIDRDIAAIAANTKEPS